MENNKSKRCLHWISLIGIIAVLVAVFIVLPVQFKEYKENKAKFIYTDLNAALEAGIKKSESDFGGTPAEADNAEQAEDKILLQISDKSKKRDFYVVKLHYNEFEMHKDAVYLLRVEQNGNKYKVEKLSAFICLSTDDETPDLEYYGPGMWIGGIEGGDAMYFTVGKIFDKEYGAYLEGRLIKTDSEGMFAFETKSKAAADLEIKRIAQ